MAIEAFSPDGKKCAPGVSGELVCTRPFPCQPAGFWPLRGFAEESAVEEAQKRYQAAYFAEYDGVWCACLIKSQPSKFLFIFEVLTARNTQIMVTTLLLRPRVLGMGEELSCLVGVTVYCESVRCKCFS